MPEVRPGKLERLAMLRFAAWDAFLVVACIVGIVALLFMLWTFVELMQDIRHLEIKR